MEIESLECWRRETHIAHPLGCVSSKGETNVSSIGRDRCYEINGVAWLAMRVTCVSVARKTQSKNLPPTQPAI